MPDEFSQVPINFPLRFVRGDEISFSRVFTGVDLTGYTVTAAVYAGLGAAATSTSVATPSVAVTTATVAGVTSSTVSVSMTETQTTAISPAGTIRWYLRWVSPGGVTKTALSGNVTAQNP